MTSWRTAVQALYAELLTWRRVANACDGPRDFPRGSYYRSIAKGRIRRPHATARRGISNAYLKHCKGGVTVGYRALGRKRRFPIVVNDPLGTRSNEWRQRHALTWNQWVARADALMRREYGD